MGTSADRTAGTGGAWTPLKRAATDYVRGLGNQNSGDRARRVLARHVPLLGGSGGATSSARAGITGVGRLGDLLSAISSGSTADALTRAGLADLIGKDRFVVLDELVTFIAGDGNDLDSSAARDAACDVLDELFAEADSWTELDAVSVSERELVQILERFLALYVYNRVPVVQERLSREVDPIASQKADLEMRQIIDGMVAIVFPADPLSVDWRGPEGHRIAEDTVRSVYELLASYESDGEQ